MEPQLGRSGQCYKITPNQSPQILYMWKITPLASFTSLAIPSPRSLNKLTPILPIALISLISASLEIPSAIAQSNFGQTGADGIRGREGRSGRDGQDIRIVSDGKPSRYDLTGTSGEDGEDGNAGQSATNCEQPYRPEYSLLGASGGNGGRGSDGGRGGNGGNALIFYTNVASLKQIEIRNGGGRGGRSGRGAVGGQGCGCSESRWQVNYCSIETQSRPANDPKAAWTYRSRERVRCGTSSDGWSFNTGFHRNLSREYQNGDWLYRRINRGVTYSNSFTCQSGRNGITSSNGNDGNTGNYGRVTLVPRLDIPSEITSDRQPLGVALGKKVNLIKNIWVERNGLSGLLSSSSDVSDRYTYLKDTARLFYRFEWAAPQPPSALGVDTVSIGADVNVRNENAEIIYNLPGTLEYEVIPAAAPENVQVVKITGGFNPNRVEAFELQKITGIGTDNQLLLSDRGDVRELLKDMQIQVQCLSKESATGVVAGDYVQRRNITFKIPPKFAPSDGAIVTGSSYTLPVGRYCSPWLRENNNALYKVTITQTTKSGATYNQNIESAFVVKN